MSWDRLGRTNGSEIRVPPAQTSWTGILCAAVAFKSKSRVIIAFFTSALVLFAFKRLKVPADPMHGLNLHWVALTPAKHYTVYGVREYTARIWNIPLKYDWEKACQRTPIVIHNRTLTHPDRCENKVS